MVAGALAAASVTSSGRTITDTASPCCKAWSARQWAAIDGAPASRRHRPAAGGHGGLDEVRCAEEGRDLAAGGPAIDIFRRAGLQDATALHDHDAIGQRHRLFLVVGDIERGDLQPPLQRAELVAHLGAQAGIEVAERLVEQQHRRARTPARGRSPRAAAGRPRAPAPAGRRGVHVDQAQRRHDALLDLGLGDVPHAQGIGDVVEHRHVRPDRVGLEHHAELAQVGRHEQAGRRIAHHAAADHDPSRCRAAPGPPPSASVVVLPQPDGPEQGDELAVLDRQIDAVDRLHLGEVPADLVQGDAGHPVPTCRSAWRARAWRLGARAVVVPIALVASSTRISSRVFSTTPLTTGA